MNIQKKDLGNSQIELTVEFSVEEFKPHILRGAEQVSMHVKIEGFRPGKVPYEILKNKIGEMTILEEAARIAIDKTIDKVISENVSGQIVGQPRINVSKLAPDNPMEYKILLAMLPEIKIGDYKNLNIIQDAIEVKDAEVEDLIAELREMRANEIISEAEIKHGDRVIADIEIFLDKIPVEGGHGKSAGLIMGKNYVIPGFDKKIIGAKKNQVREFSLPYPDDYRDKNLAGKIAEFKVSVKEVYNRILPEVSDDFAKGFGLKNPDELRDSIKKSLLSEKEREQKQKSQSEMTDKIISRTKFGDIPEMLVKHEAEVMMSELEYNVKNQGAKFEDYLAHLKKTRDQITLELMPDAVKRVKVSLVMREISGLEKIFASREEVDAAIDEILNKYKDNKNTEDKIKSREFHDYTANNLTGKKVMEKLLEWNVRKK